MSDSEDLSSFLRTEAKARCANDDGIWELLEEVAAEIERLRAALLPKSAVILGPNTLSGPPQDFGRQGKEGEWGEFCTPWRDGCDQEFDSNASRVAIWFRTWAEAQAFVAAIRDHEQSVGKDSTK